MPPERFLWWSYLTCNGLLKLYREVPVDIEHFLFNPAYMGQRRNDEFDVMLPYLEDLNHPDRFYEAVLTGPIGTWKTTIALQTTAYQLYLLSCLHSPQEAYGILPTDEILFVFQNLTATLSKVVDYERFKALLDQSEYFRTKFPYDRKITSRLKFPHRIDVVPLSGAITAAIGQNVYGGIIDEINFFAVVERSKQVRGGEGTLDAAEKIYGTISMRRKSRFLTGGRLPGILCMVSSRNYPGQFTDKKEAERSTDIRENGKSGIFLYDHTLWELRPERFKGSRKFPVFIGNEYKQPKILDAREAQQLSRTFPDAVRWVPEEFRADFIRNIHGALRDILGVATRSKHPFFTDLESLDACFDRELVELSGDRCDFEGEKIKVFAKRFSHPDAPRWIHIDLGLTSDSAGVACGCVPEFVGVKRGELTEVLPFVHMDFVLEVAPPPGGEILFYKIRDLIYLLTERGINVRWVSFDSWQSKDSQQTLAQRGYETGEQSVDRTSIPYDFTKTALLDLRCSLPVVPKLRTEVVQLERDPQRGKIDHPPNGSKDLSDAFAGVVYGLTMARAVWALHEIPTSSIPESIAQAILGQDHEGEI